MPISVITDKPAELLASINKKLVEDKIRTWKKETHNNIDYYTHTPEQYFHKAWFTPTVKKDELYFAIVYPKDIAAISKAIYGIYHGRFVEMITSHFYETYDITTITVK